MSTASVLPSHPISGSCDGFQAEGSDHHHSTMTPFQESQRNVYQILYGHPANDDFPRPITPLQITIPEGDASPTVPVSCGVVNGKMHLNLFMCPGIHQPCIEVGNDLLSPKQFTIRGDKERQKDWKASIRVGRSSLRTHMEAMTIDFYEHMNRCSGKCQSRNYVNAPSEEVLQARKSKRTSEAGQLKYEIENEMAGKEADNDDNRKSAKKARGRPRGSVNKPRQMVKMEPQDDRFFEEFFIDAPPLQSMSSNEEPTSSNKESNECTPFNDILNCLQNDPMNFWSQMQQTGVIGHFCDDIIVSAINLKQSVMDNPVTPTTANMLTRTAFALGIPPVVVHRVQSIERNAYQQRKHDEMFNDIQSTLAEEHSVKYQPRTSSSSQESLHTAREFTEEKVEELIDVCKYDDYPESECLPGPSHIQ